MCLNSLLTTRLCLLFNGCYLEGFGVITASNALDSYGSVSRKGQNHNTIIDLDGNKIRHPGLIQNWIAIIWEHLDGSSRHWSGFHNIRRADRDAIDKAVFHLSYLAKTRGKGFRPPQTKDYGWTRNICASARSFSMKE